MTKPYAIHRSTDPHVGPELYDEATDRDVAYVYPGADAEAFGKRLAYVDVLADAAFQLLDKTVNDVRGNNKQWHDLMDVLLEMGYVPNIEPAP